MAHSVVGDARHYHDRIVTHCDRIAAWVATRDATNVPPPYTRHQAWHKKGKADISDPTPHVVHLARTTMSRVEARLAEVHATLGHHAPTYDPPNVYGGIKAGSEAVFNWIVEGFRGGRENDELRSAVWTLADVELQLYSIVADYGMLPPKDMRMCRAGCGAPAPAKGEGATCQRCRKRQSRDRMTA